MEAEAGSSEANTTVCPRAALPTTFRNGRLEPSKDWYAEGESVMWVCPGDETYWRNLSPRTAQCQADGTFDRERMEPCPNSEWESVALRQR